MREILILLKPRFWSFRNRTVSTDLRSRKLRSVLLGVIGLGFWGGAFLIMYRVLVYFQSAEELGDILAYKLLSMALIAFFSLLLFSGILTSLSKLYLSRDLCLVHSLPVSRAKIFFARWLESTLDSSWMVLIYSLPLFLSYGMVYKAGAFYYATVGVNLLSFCLVASSLSALVVLFAAVALPAGRIRSVLFFLGFLVLILLVIVFRMMRPERFVRPESFSTAMLYLQSLRAPQSPWLPTTWFFDGLRGALTRSPGDVLFNSALSMSCAVALIFVTTWVAGAVYFRGLSKAQTSPRRYAAPKALRTGEKFFFDFLPGPVRAFVMKEVKTFIRDQTQWSQIFLLGALIVIFLYNYSVLPLERSSIPLKYLQNLLAFLNMGLVAFVLTAVSARFVFPSVSAEGDAFWIVMASPVSIRTFLWIKFLVYFFPLLLLSEVLIVITNVLLQVTPLMMSISVLTLLFMVPGIVSMGVGLGAIYPDFHSENPAQSVTSLGGLIYMTVSMGFIAGVVVLEAGPVYQVFMAGVHGRSLTGLQWLWVGCSFSMVLVLCLMALLIPMRMGEHRIARDEFGPTLDERLPNPSRYASGLNASENS
jgi:ABC-2 type transport system permease protein